MDIWVWRLIGDDDHWDVGQALEILDACVPAGGGLLQFAGDPGVRANYEMACQPWTERYVDGMLF